MELWQSIIILALSFGIIIYAVQVYNFKRDFILNIWLKSKGEKATDFNQGALRRFWGRMLVAIAVCVVLILVGLFYPILVITIIGGVLFALITIGIVVFPNNKAFLTKPNER